MSDSGQTSQQTPSSQQQGQASQTESSQQSKQQATSEPQYVDRETFDRSRQEYNQLSQRQSENDRTLAKLRQAFGGEREEAPDEGQTELQGLEQELDAAIHFAMSDRGKAMPKTAALEVQLAKERYENAKQRQEFNRKLASIEGRLGNVSSPEYVADQKAFDELTMFVDRSLRSLYGDDPQLSQVLEQQNAAISRQIVNEIKHLQKTDPDRWRQLRRDPNGLAQWTNNVIKQNIPPQARKIIEQEQLKNYEFSESELYQAFKEAKALPPSKERDRIINNIRQDMMSKKFAPKAQGRVRRH